MTIAWRLWCFHLTSALQTSCDNGFLKFEILLYSASSYVTVWENILSCRVMAFFRRPTGRRKISTKNRAGATYL
jgi:hypothetical protein